MFLPRSGDKNASTSEERTPHRGVSGSGKLIIGVGPPNDENVQNYRIQMAVNRYNRSGLPPFRQFPMSAYKCSFVKSKSPKTKSCETVKSGEMADGAQGVCYRPRSRLANYDEIAGESSNAESGLFSSLSSVPLRPKFVKKFVVNKCDNSTSMRGPFELRYTGPEHFPVCFLKKSPIQQPKKQNILSQLNAHNTGLPVSRFMDDSAEKYSDLKSTRSVLDVLQDMSRKRMHCKDDAEDNGKRRCKGLGGDLVQDGEVAYKPLFVPKPRNSLLPRKDQMTQTTEIQVEETSGSSPANDPKWELRKKLAKKNNEIFASLSSSLRGFLPFKRKRAADVQNSSNGEVTGPEEAISKKQRLCDKNSSLLSPDTPINRKDKTITVVDTSPKSPQNSDRLMSIYLDMQNEANIKLNAIKAINSSPGGSQFSRSSTTNTEESSNSVKNTLTDKMEKSTGNTPIAEPLAPSTASITPNFTFGTPVVKLSEKSTAKNIDVGEHTSKSSLKKAENVSSSESLATFSTTLSPLAASAIKASTPVSDSSFSLAKGSSDATPVSTLNFSTLTSSPPSLTSVTTSLSTPIITATTQDKESNQSLPQFKISDTFKFSPFTSTSPAISSSCSVTTSPLKFSFGQTSPTVPLTTTSSTTSGPFTIGNSEKTSTSPTISLPSSNAPATVVSSAASPTAFTFGSTNASNSGTPQFSFGSSSSNNTPALNFTSPKENTTALNFAAPKKDSSALNFAATNKDPPVNPPSFLFASKTDVTSPTSTAITNVKPPSFLFGKEPSKTLTFGNRLPTVSTVGSVVTTSSVSEVKPSFTENKLESSPSKFTFGSVASTSTAITSSSTIEKSSVFSRLGDPVTSKPFVFGGISNDNPTVTTTTPSFGGFGGGTPSQTTPFREDAVTTSTTSTFTFGSNTPSNTSAFGGTVTTTTAGLFNQTPTFTPTITSANALPSFGMNPPTAAFKSGSMTESPAFGLQPTSSSNFPTTTTAPNFGQAVSQVASPSPFNQTSSIFGTSSANFGQKTTSSFNSTTTAPFSFGQATATTTSAFVGSTASTSTFTFGQGTTVTTASTSAFGSSEPAASAFTFGQNKTNPATTTNALSFPSGAPVFAFGSNTASPFGQPTTPSAFGNSSATTTTTAPASTFGTPAPAFASVSGQQPFAFGQTSGSFGSNSFGASTFPFGQTPPITTTQSNTNFTFGKSSNTTAPSEPFSFGKIPAATVAPTFGTVSTTSSGFGSSISNAPSPFGGASSNVTPFGAAASQPFGSTPTTSVATSTPSLFTFGASPATKPAGQGFNFGASTSSPNPAAPFAFGGGAQPSTGFNFSANSPSTSNALPFYMAGGSNNMPGAAFPQSPTPAFGQSQAVNPGGNFAPFALPTTSGSVVPGTFSIGAGSSQQRARASVRARRRT